MKVNREALIQFQKMQADFHDARDDGKDTTEMFKNLVAFAYKHGFGQIIDDPDDMPNVKTKSSAQANDDEILKRGPKRRVEHSAKESEQGNISPEEGYPMKVDMQALRKFQKMQSDFFDAQDQGKDTPEMFKKLCAFAYQHGIGIIVDDPDDLPVVKKRPPAKKQPRRKATTSKR